MIISKEVLKIVKKKREGEVITYEDFGKLQNLNSVALALSKLYKKGILKKIGKGLFYKPKVTRFGELKPSENEILKALLRKNKQGFISGTAAQNRLGLTTQIPNRIVISGKYDKHERKIGNLNIIYKKSNLNYGRKDIELLQILDALKNINKIPDTSANDALELLKNKISKLDEKSLQSIVSLANDSKPRVRVLLGAILDLINEVQLSEALFETLNPLTNYKIRISEEVLPNKKKWKIK
jgi:hypothetical protein